MKPLLLTLALLFGCEALAADVQRIEHPQAGYSGTARVDFPAGTRLRVEKLPYEVILESYDGEWSKGVAKGQGILKGRALPFPTKASPPADAKAAEIAAATATALKDREQGNAALIAGNPSAKLLGPAPAPGTALVFRGAFDDGMASGAGELEAGYRRLQGQFARWLPEGLVIHLSENLPVLGETFSRGAPADGPVFINQYPAGLTSPSRTFVGTAKGGKVSGDWFELAWGTKAPEYERFVIGEKSRVVLPDGRRADCTYDSAWLQKPAATDLALIRGDLESRALEGADPMYRGNPVRCTSSEPNGWTYSFGVKGAGPLDQAHVPPYSCTDAQGRPGTLTIGKGDAFQCSVNYVTYEYRWGSKIGRALEEAGRDVRDALLNPWNKLGKNVLEEHICGVAQKTPGKDCFVNGSVGVSFGIPDTKAAQNARAKQDLDRFMAARKKLLLDDETSKPFWRTAGLTYDACAQSCTGPAQAFSRLSIAQISDILTSGFDDDVKHRQIASLSEGTWGVVEKWLPFGEVISGWFAAGRLGNQLWAAKEYSWVFLVSKKESERLAGGIFQEYVIGLATKHGIRSLLLVTADTAELSKEFLLHEIPGLSLIQQASLINQFGVKKLEFFSTYQTITSSRELVERLVNAKLKELKLPPMPVKVTND